MVHTDSSKSCTVSVVIKALNEERRIAACIESALQAVATVGGEVILADSFSTDRTIEIARKYPVRIVQLQNAAERCCGVGPQLGYLHAKGEFIYILDGDMELLQSYLPKALSYLDQHPNIAGIGGNVVEMNTHSLEYIARMERASGHMKPGKVDRLDMGGLYRREAIEQTGFFSNRNLHSYEELDLAVRLRSAGWGLWRLPHDAVRHYGHDAPPYSLLMRRWKSGYICGLGEVLRNAWGQPHFQLVLNDVRELRLYGAVMAWWLAIVLCIIMLPLGWKGLGAVLLLMPVALMAVRKRSIAKGIFSVVSWNFNTAGLLRGLLKTPRKPIAAVQANILQEQQ